MADSFWRYGSSSQAAGSLPSYLAKRPRYDIETQSGHDITSYYARPVESTGHGMTGDAVSINSLYHRYLRNTPSYPAAGAPSRFSGVGQRPEILLPPDANSTLFVEGLPPNCTCREVSHIFRHFIGYKEVRLVKRKSRHSPAHAATAKDALQGYQFDEHESDSGNLRLHFARHHGAKSGGGERCV